MKILWISHIVPYPPKAGVLLRSYNLLKELASRNEVYLIAFNQDAMMRAFYRDSRCGLREADRELSSFCKSVEFFDIPSEQGKYARKYLIVKSLLTRHCFTTNWLRSPAFALRLAELKKHNDFDAVHFDTASLAIYRDIFKHVPKTLTHHNIESHLLERRASIEKNILKKFYFWQEGKRLRRYERKVCNEFDFNITCSELDSARLLDIDPAIKAIEIGNGVDVNYFKSTVVKQNPHSLVFVGTMNWYPNVDAMRYLISQIWPLVKKEYPYATLDIIGPNPPDSLVKLAREETGIKVHGFVDDVRPYIERAAAYICPIRDGGGTKLKLLDAFAMSKAVICHPVASEGIASTPEENVLFATNAEDFMRQIGRVFEQPELAVQIGNRARRLVTENYSFESIGRRLDSLYKSIGASEAKGRAP